MKALSIPLNQIGVEDYENGVLESPNLICFVFPDSEVDNLFDEGVIENINEECGLGIDDYESTIISKTDLESILIYISKNKYPIFHKAITIALDKGEFLALDL